MASQPAKRRLEMKINLNALEHLGMNLYSNIPAVLSEIVANAWDADASRVSVTLGDSEISIEDDGVGMTRDEVIDRFLNVGFQRRLVQGMHTPKYQRLPMGRKGIGKLSSFSIANKVTVYTCPSREHTAFCMDAKKIRKQIRKDDSRPYKPKEIKTWPSEIKSGTRIVLTDLKHRATQQTAKGLRQRIARRFSVIGPKYNFTIMVNGVAIGPSDRGYYQHIEYCWTYGDQSEIVDRFTNLAANQPEKDRTENIRDGTGANLNVSGWIGTVHRPKFLKAEDGDNLNRLAVFMRGKLAQEDILDEFGQKEIYADYVVGEIHCDDLDQDDKDDIATSSRQTLKHDDPRFKLVREAVLRELRYIASQWSDLRRRQGTTKFSQEVPAVADWLSDLQGDTRHKAERWIGRLNVLRSGDEVKRELLKASILAFESYRRKEQLHFLETLSDENIEPILQVFEEIDDLQLSYYGQIVNLRLGVIKTLEEKLNADQKEIVIRDHIYEHLWLLDPSWERVKGSEAKEKRITNFLKETSETLSDEERSARIDIGYRTAQGRHVIIELKRASVKTPVDELTRQIRKYRSGTKKLIAQTDFPKWPLDIICLVGRPPPEWNEGEGQEDIDKALASVDARLMFYHHLLDQSRRAYADYLEEHKKVDRLWKVFEGIDNFAVVAEE